MENEEKYTKGFNNGYLLSKHHPDLLAVLTKGLVSDNDYCQGLLAGKEQHKLEKAKEKFSQYKSISPGADINKTSKDKGLNKSRD